MVNEEANNCYYSVVKNLSELNSLAWLRGKKEAIINSDNFFQNSLDDALNYQTIKTNPERICKLKTYINKCNWEGIDFPKGQKEWQKFERNNKTIALNVICVQYNTKAISVAYRPEYNSKRKKQVILLTISNGKNNLSALLKEGHQITLEIFIV